MSKYVKNLITDDLRRRLEGVRSAVLVNVVGLDAIADTRLRKELRDRSIQLVVVKNSLAARATEGTPLAPMFDGLSGSAAICWGGEDMVSLAKEILGLAGRKEFEKLEPRGGCMEGKRLDRDQLTAVSKMPSRQEMLGILVGQILAPGARLAAQLKGPGGALASQIKQKGEEKEGDKDAARQEAAATTA